MRRLFGLLSNALRRRGPDHVDMPRELDKATARRIHRWMLEQRYRELREDRRGDDAAAKPAVGESAAE
jgi:hypothetical protein